METEKKQYDLMCTLGFVIALISCILNFYGIVGIAAVVVSTIGVVKYSPEKKGKGLGIAGIVIGAVSVLFGVIGLLVVAMGIFTQIM